MLVASVALGMEGKSSPNLELLSTNAGSKRPFPFEEEEDEDDDSDMEDEELSLAVQKAYESLLPTVKDFVTRILGNRKPNLMSDIAEKPCLVCRSSQKYKGWKALLAHTEKFKKKKPIQHRGFYQALSEILLSDSKDEEKGEARCVAETRTDEHLIVWPPIVILEKVEYPNKTALLEQDEIYSKFPDLKKTSVVNILPIYSSKHNRATSLVVFEDSTIGYLDAKTFEELLAKQRLGREECERQKERNFYQQERDASSSAGRHYVHEKERWMQASPPARVCTIFGFMALPHDMKRLDPNKTTVKWSEEVFQEKVQYAHKKSKEKHDKEKAMLRARELEVERLQVSREQCISSKQHLEYLLEEKQKEIDRQMKRGEELESKHAEERRRQEGRFESDLKAFNAVSFAKEKKLRDHLELNEKQFAEEQFLRLQEVNYLRQKFEKITEKIKQEEAKEALDKEEEALRIRESCREKMLKAEVELNERAHALEMELMERQQQELIELFEENENEKQELLKKWLEDQEALQKAATEVPQEEDDNLSDEAECVICFEELGANRALLKPCGHAKICLNCALDLWKNKKPHCPICRGIIASKPAPPPSKVFL
ncbi:hypothetical protein O6H91_22G052100 [Diphasiastrum complanatum]|uniref:Uncharacterized protein n=2 Tax=Diphasiastrum complanatum TaxID=34168 RepID=A0ACC2AFR0_DIPCM|nr:hypothetical protein O6H91_22G052100 [Diphasiastrum complanatum]